MQSQDRRRIDRIPGASLEDLNKASGKPKNKLIIVYTVVVCLSCLYLETQHFQHVLGDKRAHYMAILTYFDVFMCLWSYFQTIRIDNTVPQFNKIQGKNFQTQKFHDHTYTATHKACTICNNYKFPRVHHCGTCGTCQYKMDHHCVWTQTCVGLKNMKCFYLFCFYMSIGVIQFWYFTYRVMKERTMPLFQIGEPGVIILWAFTAFSAFFVGIMIVMLFISHTAMLLTNYSTLDAMKMRKICPMPFFQTDRSPDKANLFDRGQIQNIKAFFGPTWWLWWVPTTREPENQIYPEPMSPHPAPAQLMRQTRLYQIEFQYKESMKKLPKIDFLPHFVGKKMRINDQVYLIEDEKAQILQ